MKLFSRYHKQIAAFLMLVMAVELITPATVYGLTSGPSQPETQGFEPIGNSDMVDLFTGDFSYNIPLLDVGGYPVNLAYHSGSGMDDEASWVGTGWSLNAGSVNRQLRGIPDDFNGSEKQEREMSMKDHITKGGRFSVSLDLLGIPVSKVNKKKKKKKLNLKLTLSAGVKIDNYRGVGAEIGANAGATLTEFVAGAYTQKKQDSATGKSLGLPSVGVNLSSMDGASVSFNADILRKSWDQNDKTHSVSKSIGFGYNSRSGLTGMTLSSSFSSAKEMKNKKGIAKMINTHQQGTNSFISFNSDTYTPTINHDMKNTSYTLSVNGGLELSFAYLGGGVTGFYSKQEVADNTRSMAAYGYLNSEKGVDDSYGLMDFNREKDIPYNDQIKYLPIPVPTYDLFSAGSQDGGGQYRLYRGSSGVFFDPRAENKSNDFTLGIEAGGGGYFDVGADMYFQHIETVSRKWKDRNRFLGKGDFIGRSTNTPLYEPAYFKRIGEPVPYDNGYVNKIKGVDPVAVNLTAKVGDAINGAEASDLLRTKRSPNGEGTEVLKRDKREVRNTNFSYLTAVEAASHALDKTINDHHPDSLVLNNCNTNVIRNTFSRVGDYRKANHFSEITITGDDGKRSVFGIPVYNAYQEEVSFSIDQNLLMRNKGLIKYNDGDDNTTINSKGLERYYSREKTPPYATSYLLTAILSPDYVDKTGNGVTDDDLGTAVKLNYSRLNNLYNWRTPFAFGQDTANYNEGYLSDPIDDKANYVYGQKEIWYLHSIESKTMVAHFILGDRKDALGVLNSRGAADTTHKLKYLKEIRLYSKSDLRLNNNDPAITVPIKVVHFEYDYSLYRSLPNSVNNSGKLTLKKVYFTFGVNQKGKLNPYEFKYDTANYNHYDYRQYDRWGSFKNAADNPDSLNNAEFPYTLQDTALTNKYVSACQLNEIVLPSGGNIHVTYESDDYAYVQDKRASQMCMLQGVGNQGDSTGLANADYIYVTLPKTVSSQGEMMERYFEGVENLYYKFLLDLDNRGHKEFVPGYAKIIGTPQLVGNDIAQIRIEKKGGTNTIAKSGWQFVRMSLPKYAYPGSDNFLNDGSDLKKAVKALVTAFGTIKELIYGFDKRAKKNHYSDNVELSKSWVRLCSPEWKKLGGGSRVKRIDITDDWAAMSGATGAKTATYSQVYDYTTIDAKGRTVSSGVASYEPLIGNDENPFRQPIRYKQKEFLGLDNFYYIEEPFGESFFPAASVGYSKVTIQSIGSGDEETVNRTGVTVSEFYTAKDYPTKVTVLGLQQRSPGTGKLFKLISNKEVENVGLSQGYSIELNDMHGKQRSTKIFNKSGENISSIEYFYQSENELADKKTLSNNVKVIESNGIVSDGTIGMDVEMFTDMRQQTTDNLGISVKVSGGAGAIFIFPLPFFFPGIGVNYDRRCYRAASTVKIVQRFAIQYKTRKMENGSFLTAENLLWDAETGNVLLTKTQNEFNDAVYSMSYPAHWVYDGMAQAYKNLGTIFSGFSTGSNGDITNAVYDATLAPGDEMIDINDDVRYWVINSPVSDVYSNRLIDKDGNLQQISNRTLKLIRSGRRNMASAAIASIASLNNPVVGDRLQVTQLTQVLDAKAAVFSEEWSAPIMKNCNQPACPQGCSLSGDSTYCYSVAAHYPEPPTTSDFDSICAYGHGYYGTRGTYIYTLFNTNGTFDTTQPPVQIDTSNHFWTNPNEGGLGPLNRCGIWRCGSRGPARTWVGFTTLINVPATKTYYIGIGGDNQAEIVVDGTTIVRQDREFIAAQGPLWNQADPTYRSWHIFPVTLTAGQRTIQLRGWNVDSTSDASFGAEIYDNTAIEISQATSYDHLNIVFSSKDFINRSFTPGQYIGYNCPPGYTLDSTGGVFMCRDTSVCQVSYGTHTIFNPYYSGILGNWRPKSQYAYQVSRVNLVGNPALLGSTNIRRSGAYSVFNPFWQYNYSSLTWQSNPATDQRWIAANEITYVNSKGLEIENRDALNRYSAALFGYLESLPVAVATNAQYREIAYDGFEDYGFTLDCGEPDTCNTGHFNFRKFLNGSSIALSNEHAHSGKYSLKLTTPVTVNKTIFVEAASPLFSFDDGSYRLETNELAKGFSPVPGKRYVLSFWVKDESPRDATTSVQASINGTNLVNSSVKWPIVEGWKRVEVPFILPVVSTAFSLQLQGSGAIYLDDIRIFPFDAQLKTFAYDASSQRLWAELDENNFATCYEYDDEGILIRVKKETERGMMTIRETRSSYRKRS